MHKPDTVDRPTEGARALLEVARRIRAERHPTHAFAAGTLLSPTAAQHAGIDPVVHATTMLSRSWDEGAIEWDKSARYAR